MSQKGEARPETGRMKFKGDWTGIFLRGDSASNYAHHLRQVIGTPDGRVSTKIVQDLIDLLESSEEPTVRDVQHMKEFDKCKSNEPDEARSVNKCQKCGGKGWYLDIDASYNNDRKDCEVCDNGKLVEKGGSKKKKNRKTGEEE